MSVWRWLQNTPLVDPVERKLAPLLQLAIIAIAVALGVAFLIAILQLGLAGIALSGIVLALLFWLALGSILALVRRGYFKTTALLLVVLIYATSTRRLLLAEANAADEALVTFFLPLTIAGLFLSRRVLLVFLVLTCLLVLLPFENEKLGSGTVTTFIFNVVLVSLLLDLLASTLRGELTTLKTHAAELFQLNERLTITLRSIGDGVITTDAAGCIVLVNEVAQRLTGWTQAEAAGKPLMTVFRIVNEYTRQPVENPAEKVMRTGGVVGLANHTILIARDGRELPIDDSGAPIADSQGNIAGVVLVFRDITERKAAEQRDRELAALHERQRLARELHDAVSQSLFSASVIAEALPRLWERRPERAREQVDELRKLTQGASAEMRTLLLELRPENIMNTPLDALLTQLIQALRARKPIDTSVVIANELDQPLPDEVHFAFYRVAQESLNNVMKHGRQASQVRIRYRRTPAGASLIIVDNGQGFDQEQHSPGFGLTTMRERAAGINASLTVKSKIGCGTRVRLVWKAAP